MWVVLSVRSMKMVASSAKQMHPSTVNPPKNNLITTLSGVSNTNYLHTITIGSDGLGLFAYFDFSRRSMVAHCEDLECTSATIRVWTKVELWVVTAPYPLDQTGWG